MVAVTDSREWNISSPVLCIRNDLFTVFMACLAQNSDVSELLPMALEKIHSQCRSTLYTYVHGCLHALAVLFLL